MASDTRIQDEIRRLVSEEHSLRSSTHRMEVPEQHAVRLEQLEEQLDQCWDLLRQRRALRAVGADPAGAHVRPAPNVEGYLQ